MRALFPSCEAVHREDGEEGAPCEDSRYHQLVDVMAWYKISASWQMMKDSVILLLYFLSLREPLLNDRPIGKV